LNKVKRFTIIITTTISITMDPNNDKTCKIKPCLSDGEKITCLRCLRRDCRVAEINIDSVMTYHAENIDQITLDQLILKYYKLVKPAYESKKYRVYAMFPSPEILDFYPYLKYLEEENNST